MGLRKTILATGETYHIYNRSVAGIPIFRGDRECKLFLEAVKFYLQPDPPTRFSIFRTSKERFPIKLDSQLVTIISFSLMPNHYHFILRQEQENGIKKFIQRLTNSFAHYFVRKYRKSGHVFEGNFKAVHIETNEQLVHLSRYIDLNPVTAYLVEEPDDYPYSSYQVYMEKESLEIVDPSLVLSQFSTRNDYKKFVLDQKDYQRRLEEIKHLTLE
ncbi:transposase [Candidatus Gottesmanbacteria bacterium]|nr:transposase [Candidatus Gottesmanbacteria bacterium]